MFRVPIGTVSSFSKIDCRAQGGPGAIFVVARSARHNVVANGESPLPGMTSASAGDLASAKELADEGKIFEGEPIRMAYFGWTLGQDISSLVSTRATTLLERGYTLHKGAVQVYNMVHALTRIACTEQDIDLSYSFDNPAPSSAHWNEQLTVLLTAVADEVAIAGASAPTSKSSSVSTITVNCNIECSSRASKISSLSRKVMVTVTLPPDGSMSALTNDLLKPRNLFIAKEVNQEIAREIASAISARITSISDRTRFETDSKKDGLVYINLLHDRISEYSTKFGAVFGTQFNSHVTAGMQTSPRNQ